MSSPWNCPLYEEIVAIMEKIQQTSSCHEKYKSVLHKLQEKTDPESYFECIKRILTVLLNEDPKKKNPFVEKAFEFFALFLAHEHKISTVETLLEKVFDILLDASGLDNVTYRYRACQLTNKLLNNLSDTELSTDLCHRIEEAMLCRIQEEAQSQVQLQAILAVYRMQNPGNRDCRVISTMLTHMNGDVNAKIRALCVQKISIQRHVLSALVVRVRDVNTAVRLAAFTRLSKLAKYLKIGEKHLIIKHGFLDSSDEVKDYVANQLVPAWLSEYEDDYLQLLKSVRLDANEQLIEKSLLVVNYMLTALFCSRPGEEILAVLPINDKMVLDYDHLNWESVIYWSHLIHTFRNNDKYELHLSAILPELVEFVHYIKNYCQREKRRDMEFQFIVNELFTITQGYEFYDPVNRQVLNKLIATVLKTTELSVKTTTTIVKNLELTTPSAERRYIFISELISDIMYPVCDEENLQKSLETSTKIAEVKVQLNILREDLNTAVRKEDYKAAASHRDDITMLTGTLLDLEKSLATPPVVVKKTDPGTVLKCLNILRGLLVSPKVTSLSPVIKTLCDDLVIQQLTDDNAANEVRTRALECYALSCTLDRTIAEKGMFIFNAYLLQASDECDTEQLKIAIDGTADLLVLYGGSIMNPQTPEAEPSSPLISLTEVVQALVDFMDHESMEIQLCSTHALCNLIYHCTVQSSSLISRMVLKWCNPISDSEDAQELRQLIGIMLEKLPNLPGSAIQIEKAVLPTIKTLLRAPAVSPLSEVNVQDIIKFLLALCNICVEADNLHSNLAVSICFELRDHPDEAFNVVLSKVLLMLDLPRDLSLISDLVVLCDELQEEIDDRATLNNIVRFNAVLDNLKNTRDMSVIPEE